MTHTAHRGPDANAATRAEWDALGALYPSTRRPDLSGTRLGRWRVIDGPRRRERWGTTGAAWLLKCSCGALAIGAGSALVRGRAPRCRPRAELPPIRVEDWPTLPPLLPRRRDTLGLVGRRFGTLTVEDGPRTGRAINGRTHALWLARCACGQARVAGANELADDRVRSCGTCRPPPIPESPRWGELVALASSEYDSTLARFASLPDVAINVRLIEQILDGKRVRRGGALERRLERMAVGYVAERDCLRLGMTPEAIERTLSSMAAERRIGDVAREQAARLAERAA